MRRRGPGAPHPLAERLPFVGLAAALLFAALFAAARPLVGETGALLLAGFPAVAGVVGAVRLAAGDPPLSAALRGAAFAAAVVAVYWLVFMPRRPAWMQ